MGLKNPMDPKNPIPTAVTEPLALLPIPPGTISNHDPYNPHLPAYANPEPYLHLHPYLHPHPLCPRPDLYLPL
jgi:hypothetical protein